MNKINNVNCQSGRIYYLDVLRVIACMAVIMIHTGAIFNEDFDLFNFCVGNFFNGISRVAVPLFVMISGALLLDEKYNYSSKKLIGHIKKMIFFFVFWSASYCMIYKLFFPILSGETINIAEIIKHFIVGHYHLWYIYMIIGLYLILPLLRLWVKVENKKYIEYFLILGLIFTFLIPQIISVGSTYISAFKEAETVLNLINVRYVGGYTLYFILGWYLHNFTFKKLNYVCIYLLGIIGLIVGMVGTYVYWVIEGSNATMYNNMTVNVLFYTVMVFLLIKRKIENKKVLNNKIFKLVNFISRYSLGIYAMHALVISVMFELILPKLGLENALIIIPIIFITSLIVSLIGAFVFSKIPVLKNLI